MNCESDQLNLSEYEGIKAFCEDGIRFSHAYTTSTLSQAAMASLLTGLYPIEHGLRHNGNQSLSAKWQTVAEAAAYNGYQTSFFSGGPPLLRKSGLSQGFEVFDDHFKREEAVHYRPAKEVNELFFRWRTQEVGGDPFFSVLYFADLQFTTVTTVSDLGEVRARSFDGQLRAVAEAVTRVVQYLKSHGRWHNSHVVLVGLNGRSSGGSELPPLNIHSDKTQVAFFFKPARRMQDQGPQWAVDRNVSLADLGHTLYELVGTKPIHPANAELERVSLSALAANPQADWQEERTILTETAWGEWRNVSGIRYGFRRRHYFMIYDAPTRVYNTLLDRLEQTALPRNDPLGLQLGFEVRSLAEKIGIQPWAVSDEKILQYYKMAQKWWTDDEPSEDDPAFAFWQMQKDVKEANWVKLQQTAERATGAGVFYRLAKRFAGGEVVGKAVGCESLFDLRKSALNLSKIKTCEDVPLIQLYIAKVSVDEDERAMAIEGFLPFIRAEKLKTALGSLNYQLFLPWDVSTFYPSGLTLSDLFLAMPENKKLLEVILSRLPLKDQTFDL